MFGEVWTWAGVYRRTELNIGVAPHRIAEEAAILFSDARFWISHESYAADEIAVRLHHRLVFIHPFANGNGRHARLMADLSIRRLGRDAFTWGGGSIAGIGEIRRAYVDALRAADANDYENLIAFARS
jgi:Fic-DOC domain mobile mystery protein B